jgi:hypothetical protein
MIQTIESIASDLEPAAVSDADQSSRRAYR